MRVRLVRARQALRARLLAQDPGATIGPSDDPLAASVSEDVSDEA